MLSANSSHQLDIAFYGDDFTGSTDVMESLALAAIPTALFMEVPTLDEVKNFMLTNPQFKDKTLRAIGVAGISRSYKPNEAAQVLPSIFEKIAHLKAAYFHYKICSTFDSSPQIGSIGKAIELAEKYFESEIVPLLVAAPRLNRHVVFGNLFARINDVSYRLDRHPTMSKHPITPMNESDLLLHLSEQTAISSGLVDVFTIEKGHEAIAQKVNILKSTGNKITLFDTLNAGHLRNIGDFIKKGLNKHNQLIVGSSAVEHALFHHQNHEISLDKAEVGKAKNLIVMSGSCSPVTAEQILFAKSYGFGTIALDTLALLKSDTTAMEEDRIMALASEFIHKNMPLICYSALGPDDSTLALVKNINGAQDHLPELQGELLRKMIEKFSPDRVIVAGGDTSGKVSGILKIKALEFLMELAPGAPMCLAHSSKKEINGLQIVLKGGQNGSANFFTKAYEGK